MFDGLYSAIWFETAVLRADEDSAVIASSEGLDGGLRINGPWIMLVVYDMLLYIFRAIIYELPFFGGRATGQQRPRAPSLTERPSGQPRKFSMSAATSADGETTSGDGLRNRATAAAAATDGNIMDKE